MSEELGCYASRAVPCTGKINWKAINFPYIPLYHIGPNGEEGVSDKLSGELISSEEYTKRYGISGTVMHTEKGFFKYNSEEELNQIMEEL